MSEQTVFTTGDSPEITITAVGGDLRLSGWEQNQFLAESDEGGDVRAEQSNDRIALVCGSHCAVRVPRRARVKVLQVGGDARVKSIESPMEIQSVSGDLALRQTADATLGHIGGAVSAKRVQGCLLAKFVGGDLSARSVAGDLSAESVGGDLYVRDASASVRARVRGEAILSAPFTAGNEYQIDGAGDVICRVPPGVSAIFTVNCGGDVSVDIPNAKVTGDGRQRVITLGDGAAQVSVRAGGDVALAGISTDPEALGELGEHFGEDFGVMAEELSAQIESQIESQMAQFERQLNARLAGLGAFGVDAERISERVRRKAEAARRKAQVKMEAAQRKAEVAQRRAERRAGHGKHGVWAKMVFDTSRPAKSAAPPAPPPDPVTDEERMTILRMVEQGKISVAEAEKLLAALEGKAAQ